MDLGRHSGKIIKLYTETPTKSGFLNGGELFLLKRGNSRYTIIFFGESH